MADIITALYSKLSTTAGLTSLVSTRIYPDVMPQPPTLPAVVYQMISNEREERHRGQTGDARPRFQITAWAVSAIAAAAVAEQIRLAVMAMDGTIATVDVHGVWNAGETRGLEIDDQTQVKRHYCALDFLIAHKEAVA